MQKIARCAVLVALSFCPVALLAQNYPVKAVRVVIPWPPGGSNDLVGRIVMQKMSELLGQQFVIDNRGGASGAIGSEVVAKAPPDGYTIMVHSATHLGNAFMYKKLSYDTLKDFTPVALLAAQPGALTVHPSLPTRTVKEFIALARARPGQITYASSGNGSAPHLTMALFTSMTNLKLIHVPYKGGGPAITALMSGETQCSLATIATVISHIQSGRLRALGVSSAKSSVIIPDVPAIADAGVPGYEMVPWIAVYGPAGMPTELVSRINGEINRALRSADVDRALTTLALDPWVSTPAEFAARIKVDYDKYGKLIAMTGAKVD
jgi:tripartite-type tricarboxylate transporter receptor subunit TctC